MRTQTIASVTRFNALGTSALEVTGASADVMLAAVAVVAVSALTRCSSKPLDVITSSAIFTQVSVLTAIKILAMFACDVFRALTHVAVSLVDALAVIQTCHAIFASSVVRLTVKPA